MIALYFNIDRFLEDLPPDWVGKVELASIFEGDSKEIPCISIRGRQSSGMQIAFRVGFPGLTDADVKRHANLYQCYLDTFLAKRKKANEELLMASIPGYTPRHES